jgi:hypothetical protein
MIGGGSRWRIPLLTSIDAFDAPGRTFQVWFYTVGMRRLILRSTKDEQHPTRIDVLLQGVTHLKLPTLLVGLSIRRSSSMPSPIVVGGLGQGAYSPMTLLLQCNSIEGVRWLRSAFLTIARAEDPGDLAQSPGVTLKGVASLKLRVVKEAPRNHLLVLKGNALLWTASAEEWKEMTYLLDPFLVGETGHQYLTTDGVDDVLVEVSCGEQHQGFEAEDAPLG